MATAAVLSDFAPAKINLTLRVGRRRADGYHDLESLVVFADIADDLRLVEGDTLGLSVAGETAVEAGDVAGNLVLKAAHTLQSHFGKLRTGHFHLNKTLPVAAGLGGGSSDAAAALRLLARANGFSLDDPHLIAAARNIGADVPVCLDPRPRVMRGIGDVLSKPLNVPPLHAVLVNPRVAVSTARVFAARDDDSVMRETPAPKQDPASHFVETTAVPTAAELMSALAQSANDLEAPAIALCPAIAEVGAALRMTSGCRLARMSGSGATCFGLFEAAADANSAATGLQSAHLHWWIRATTLGAAPPISE